MFVYKMHEFTLHGKVFRVLVSVYTLYIDVVNMRRGLYIKISVYTLLLCYYTLCASVVCMVIHITIEYFLERCTYIIQPGLCTVLRTATHTFPTYIILRSVQTKQTQHSNIIHNSVYKGLYAHVGLHDSTHVPCSYYICCVRLH